MTQTAAPHVFSFISSAEMIAYSPLLEGILLPTLALQYITKVQ
jgi:hypothetical protein